MNRGIVTSHILPDPRNQDWRGHRCNAPGQRNPSVDTAHVARTEEVGGEGGHRTETSAIGEANDGKHNANATQTYLKF